MCFANISDMTKRFGSTEIQCLADKEICSDNAADLSDPLNTGTIRVQCALDDAASYMLQKLSCCFDSKQLLKWCNEGKVFPLLNFWQVNIARYYLQDIINMSGGSDKSDTEQYRRYKQVKEDIEDFCKKDCCTVIVDSTGDCCLEKLCKVSFAVAKRKKSCIPDVCCTGCGLQKGGCCCSQINDQEYCA